MRRERRRRRRRNRPRDGLMKMSEVRVAVLCGETHGCKAQVSIVELAWLQLKLLAAYAL